MAGNKWSDLGSRWSTPALVLVVVLLPPAAAQADGIFTAFGGASFGSDQSERVTTLGLSLAGMAGGVFGFELDFWRMAKAKTDVVFVTDGRTTTLTGAMSSSASHWAPCARTQSVDCAGSGATLTRLMARAPATMVSQSISAAG